jgi:hypothetical protein
MSKRRHEEDDFSDDKTTNWEVLRNLLTLHISGSTWTDADSIASLDDLYDQVRNILPAVSFSHEDLQLALYSLSVPFERNEHNNKFYYLVKWT